MGLEKKYILLILVLAFGLFAFSLAPNAIPTVYGFFRVLLVYSVLSLLIGVVINERTVLYVGITGFVSLIFLTEIIKIDMNLSGAPFPTPPRTVLYGLLLMFAGAQIGKKYMPKYNLEQKIGVPLTVILVLVILFSAIKTLSVSS